METKEDIHIKSGKVQKTSLEALIYSCLDEANITYRKNKKNKSIIVSMECSNVNVDLFISYDEKYRIIETTGLLPITIAEERRKDVIEYLNESNRQIAIPCTFINIDNGKIATTLVTDGREGMVSNSIIIKTLNFCSGILNEDFPDIMKIAYGRKRSTRSKTDKS